MFWVSADANASAGAPWPICVTSVFEPAKLKVTLTPGFAASYCLPIVVNGSVRDAAAKIVSLLGDPLDPVLPEDDEPPPSPPQAAGATAATTVSSRAPRRFMTDLRSGAQGVSPRQRERRQTPAATRPKRGPHPVVKPGLAAATVPATLGRSQEICLGKS